MIDDFATVMKNNSDQELISIVTSNRNNYQEPAISAAEFELEQRGLMNDDLKVLINEAVNLKDKSQPDFIYTGFEKRLLARFIDVMLIAGINLALVHNYSLNKNEANELAVVLFYFLYYPIFETTGGTIGKKILKITTVDAETHLSISAKQAYKRSIFLTWPLFLFVLIIPIYDALDIIPFTIFSFISFLFLIFSVGGPLAMLWSKTRQGWHDSWAKVIVINKVKADEKENETNN